ncbi:MAG: HutD family protein [Rhodanobacteraceae bacterium]
MIRCLRESGYRRQRWKNGRGWTTEIARNPAGSDDPFRWRISVADIERDGAFSTYPGTDRILLLLAGNGIELAITGRSEPVRLLMPHAQFRFPGDTRIHCRLLDGPTRDFNVMYRRGVIDAEVETRRLDGASELIGVSESLLYVSEGEITTNAEDSTIVARTGETLHVDLRDRSFGTLRFAGKATLVVVKLTEVHTTI